MIGDIGDPGSVCAQDAWSILVFNLAIVVALVLFRRQLESLWDQGQQIHDSLRRDAVTRARADEATRVRQEHIDVAQRVAGPILEALATGQADPLDPRTRDEAGRAEGALRALATISAAVRPDQAQSLAGLVLGAHARGVTLHLSLPAHLAAGHPLAPDPTSPVLEEFVAACPAGSIAQLTYLHLGPATQALALGRTDRIRPPRPAPGAGPGPGHVDTGQPRWAGPPRKQPRSRRPQRGRGTRPTGRATAAPDRRRVAWVMWHASARQRNAQGMGDDGSADRDRRRPRTRAHWAGPHRAGRTRRAGGLRRHQPRRGPGPGTTARRLPARPRPWLRQR